MLEGPLKAQNHKEELKIDVGGLKTKVTNGYFKSIMEKFKKI